MTHPDDYGKTNGLRKVLTAVTAAELEQNYNTKVETANVKPTTAEDFLLMIAEDIMRAPLDMMLKLGQQLAKHNKTNDNPANAPVENMMMIYNWAKELTGETEKNRGHEHGN